MKPSVRQLLRAVLRPLAVTALFGLASLSAAQVHDHLTLFTGNTGGYHSYRIPSIMRTNNGTLIAVCEGRMDSASDWGNINLVCKRSTNNGASWGGLQEILGVTLDAWTNPTMVYDPPSTALPTANARTNGRVWLFFNWHSGTATSMSDIGVGDRRTYVTYSDDNGATWATRVNMTGTLTPPTMSWDAVGPGIGIRMTQAHVGRLVVPATGRNFYSDDHGATWHYASVPGGTGESTIVECLGGDLLRNDRPTSTTWANGSKRRYVSRGTIEGGFPAFTPDNDLLDPKCEASILRYNFDAPDRIIFLHSASTIDSPQQEGRSKMYVRISYDDGASWPVSRWLYDWLTTSQALAQGKGGYSSMIKTSDYAVAALVEANPGTYRSIDFHKFNLEWIRNGLPDP
jgi:sialidase-1